MYSNFHESLLGWQKGAMNVSNFHESLLGWQKGGKIVLVNVEIVNEMAKRGPRMSLTLEMDTQTLFVWALCR